MRKLSVLTATLIMTLGWAIIAQANVLNHPGSYKIKFDGLQYAYYNRDAGGNPVKDFLSGEVESDEFIKGNGLIGPGNSPVSGYETTAVVWGTSMNKLTNPPYGGVAYPPVYESSDGGLYLSVLSGMYAYGHSGTVDDGNIFMTAGKLDWYYFEDLSVQDIASMQYVPGIGMAVGSEGNYTKVAMDEENRFVSFNLRDGTLNIDRDSHNAMKGNIVLYGDVTAEYAGSIFDSNMYGENGDKADISFESTINWNGEYFHVNDPAYITATPEPSTVILISMGLLLSALYMRRNRTIM